jgi:hypothetical protein
MASESSDRLPAHCQCPDDFADLAFPIRAANGSTIRLRLGKFQRAVKQADRFK